MYCFPFPNLVEAASAPDLPRYLDFVSRDTHVLCPRVTWAFDSFIEKSTEKFPTNPALQGALIFGLDPVLETPFLQWSPARTNAPNSPIGTTAAFGSTSL
jgi:hypothetical protein